MVVGVLPALAIALLFDAPTSVILLVALVTVFSFLTICSGRARRR